MTIITREDPTDLVVRPMRPASTSGAAPVHGRTGPPGRRCDYRGTGVLMSRASHRRRPVTPVTTVAAGPGRGGHHRVARSGRAARRAAGGAGSRCRVGWPSFRCRRGSRCEQLAQRVAPDAPVGAVVDQIRDLNELRLRRGGRRADADRAGRLIRGMRRETRCRATVRSYASGVGRTRRRSGDALSVLS